MFKNIKLTKGKIILLCVLLIPHAIDIILTYLNFRKHGTKLELNPIIWLVNQNQFWFFLLNSLAILIVVWIILKINTAINFYLITTILIWLLIPTAIAIYAGFIALNTPVHSEVIQKAIQQMENPIERNNKINDWLHFMNLIVFLPLFLNILIYWIFNTDYKIEAKNEH